MCALSFWKNKKIGPHGRKDIHKRYEPPYEISNNVVCATSKSSDQPVYTHSLIRAFACRLNILGVLSYCLNTIWSFKAESRLYKLVWVYTCQNTTLLEITWHGSIIWVWSWKIVYKLRTASPVHYLHFALISMETDSELSLYLIILMWLHDQDVLYESLKRTCSISILNITTCKMYWQRRKYGLKTCHWKSMPSRSDN